MKSKNHLLYTLLAALFTSAALFSPIASAADCKTTPVEEVSEFDEYDE